MSAVVKRAGFSFQEFGDWFARNGINISDVTRAEFVAGANAAHFDRSAPRARVYLQVTQRVRDEDGKLFVVQPVVDGVAAVATETVLYSIDDLPEVGA